MIDLEDLTLLSYGDAALDAAVGRPLPFAIQSLDDFLLDVTTRKTEREPTMMDRLVAEDLKKDGPTRRWFLRAGLSIGAVVFMSVFPGAPVNAAGTTFFAATTGDNSDGTTWAKAKTTITAGIAVCGVGDYLLVDSALSTTATAAITYTPPAGGLAIISVTPSGAASFSAFTAGAAEAVGAAAQAFSIAGAAGSAMYMYGVSMTAGTNSSTSSSFNINATLSVHSKLVMHTCTISCPSTATGATIYFGPTAASSSLTGYIRAINCTFVFSSKTPSTGAMTFRTCDCEIINPTFSFGATKQSPLIVGLLGCVGKVIIRDGDMSSYSGTAIVGVSLIDTLQVILQDMKLNATPTLKTGTWNAASGSIWVRNSDSANTLYTFQYESAYGSLVAENTDFVTTGGASFNGAPVAWKIVTSSLASEFSPFILPPLSIWNNTTTAQTYAIEFAQVNGASALTDRQIWSDIDYAASASFPNYTFASNRNAQPFVGTGVAHATSTNPWTVPNIGANPVTQKLQSGTATTPATFTAAAKGLLVAQVRVAVATLTMWMNPAIDGVT